MKIQIRRFLLVASCCVASFATSGVAAPACQRLEDRLSPTDLASVGLTAEQLARLNELLCARPVDTTPVPPAAGRGAIVGLDATEITARLRGTIQSWEPGTEFTLENGQVWKVLKGRYRLPRPLEGPTVRVIPGLAGRWFLEVDPDAPKARVYRID